MPSCKALQQQHLFPDIFIRVPKAGTDEIVQWCKWLSTDEASLIEDSRVWIGHFPEKLLLCSRRDADGAIECSGIQKEDPKFFPSCTENQIKSSFFYGCKSAPTFSDYETHLGGGKKKRMRSPRKEDPLLKVTLTDVEVHPPSNEKKAKFNFRQMKAELGETFMCTTVAIDNLIKTTDSHARMCAGTLVIRKDRSYVSSKMGLRFNCRCSLREDCAGARKLASSDQRKVLIEKGVFNWFSSPTIMEIGGKIVSSFQLLFAIASTLTAATKKTAEQMCR